MLQRPPAEGIMAKRKPGQKSGLPPRTSNVGPWRRLVGYEKMMSETVLPALIKAGWKFNGIQAKCVSDEIVQIIEHYGSMNSTTV